MNKLHSPDSEISIIGGLLMDNSAYDRIVDIVRPCMFSNLRNAEIYKAITAILDENKPVDVVTLSDSIDRDIATLSDLVTIVQNTPSAANIKSYAKILKSKWQAREAIRIANENQELLLESESDEIEKTLLDHAAQLESLTQESSDDRTECNNEIMKYGISRISSRQDGNLSGLKTGLTELDNRIKGFNAGDLIIIAGRPSMGKTATALSIVNNIALDFVNQNKWVLFFSMEMEKGGISDRQLSSQSGVALSSILSGELDDAEYNKLSKAANTQRNILTDFRGNLSVGQVRAKARRENKKHPIGLIVIDYLQLMKTGKAESQNIAIGEVTKELKALAKEMQVPVVVLSQLNRGVEQRSNKRPIMSDLRDSGSIEQDADMIFMLYRDEYYNPETMNKGVIEIITSKNRNGETGTDYLAFRGECVRIDDLAHGWSYQQSEEPKKAGKGFKLGSAA